MEKWRNTSVLRFGTYEVDPHAGELRKGGVRIKVQQQPLKLLEILLEHPGEVVTREELRSRIWPEESFGDFDQAVNVAIAKLRSALGDSADNPRFIETIPRRGYRFLAEVSVLNADGGKFGEDPSPRNDSEAAPPAPPQDVKTTEELYLIGLRAQQFHDPAIDPHSIAGCHSAGKSFRRYAGLFCRWNDR